MSLPRILVVEDEAKIARHLQRILVQLGYEVVAAVSTGEEALSLAETTSPDLVLMDIMLAGQIDGIEAAERIHLQWNIPVIYLTAYAGDKMLERAKIAEPFGYLLKPFRQEELHTAIEMALHKSRADRLLRESEEKHKELAQLLPQLVFETDTEGVLSFMNSPGLGALGYPEQQLASGLNIFQLVHANDRDSFVAHMSRILNGESLEGLEYIALRKDGSAFPAVAYCTAIVRDKKAIGVRGVSIDITERKRAEELLQRSHDELETLVSQRTAELNLSNQELVHEITVRRRAEAAARQSELLFRTVFDSARDCIFVKDLSLKYILVNPFMASLFGVHESHMVGRTDEELFGPEAADHLKEVDLRVLTGETVEREHSLPVKGTTMIFLDIRVPMRDAHGAITGICGVAHDITGRRKPVVWELPGATQYRSDAMRSALQAATVVAQTDSTVLLTGESGSGKDYLARHIHEHSKRAGGPFFAVNCAAVAPELAESELFGHEPGAFTGARGRIKGLLELAEGGTLLLNEIGELIPSLQSKLLTFLDTRSFTRVGGRELVRVSARLIAATNRDLEKEVADGRFRQDLYYRLNVFSIRVPALRERLEDLPALIKEILSELGADMQLTALPEIDVPTIERLNHYNWPGNVRELRNVLERALIISREGKLEVDLFGTEEKVSRGWSLTVDFPGEKSLTQILDELTDSMVAEALHRSQGKRQEAAQLLGISRHALKRFLKKKETLDEH
ncbi:MAG: sigma 54-interacting transcriptional regulator [Thermodesulfobacteriota bacterium]